MAKKAAARLTIALLSASLVVPMFDCFDVGAADNVSLQCGVNTFMAADLHPVMVESEDGETAVTQTVYLQPCEAVVTPADRTQDVIDSNTFTIVPEEGAEPLDESLFTYDGSDVFIKVDSANLRMEPSIEADIIEAFERGTSFVRISYGSDWSRVRYEDGTEGYLLSSLLTDDESEFEPEEELTEEEVTFEQETTTETTEATTATTTTTVETTAETTSAQTTETQAAATETTAETTVETTPATETAPSYTESECYKTVYTTCVINLRTGPGVDYPMVRVLQTGEQVDVVAITSNGWYRTANGNYVKADLTTEQAPATPTPVPVTDTATATSTEESAAPSSGYSDFASYCMTFLGVPYQYGGNSPSAFDCSGYVSYVMANYYGVSLPHDAASIATLGSPVSMDSMQCGDVLCHDYNGDGVVDHVSIYIGGGTYIHASDSRHGVITTTYAGAVTTIRRFI